jgi:hypothetical protein
MSRPTSASRQPGSPGWEYPLQMQRLLAIDVPPPRCVASRYFLNAWGRWVELVRSAFAVNVADRGGRADKNVNAAELGTNTVVGPGFVLVGAVRCSSPVSRSIAMSTLLCTATRDGCADYVAPTTHVLTIHGCQDPALPNDLDRGPTVPNGAPWPAGELRNAAGAGLASCFVVSMSRRGKGCQPLSARCSWKCVALNPPGQPPATNPAVTSPPGRGALRQAQAGPITSLTSQHKQPTGPGTDSLQHAHVSWVQDPVRLTNGLDGTSERTAAFTADASAIIATLAPIFIIPGTARRHEGLTT